MSLLDDLRGAFLTEGLSDEQLHELLEVGEEVRFGPGDELFREGRPAETMWILIDGEIELSRTTGQQTVTVGKLSNRGQWAGGLTAWAAQGIDSGYRATGRAVADGRALAVPSTELGRLIGEWLPLGKHLLMGIYGTVRSIDATAREQEKFAALGTHAARLAHELNNPAAASLRTVEALRTTGSEMLAALAGLAEQSLTAQQYLAIDALRLGLQARSVAGDSPVERMDREDALGAWLDDRAIEGAWTFADALAAAGADTQWLDELAGVIEAGKLPAALRWVSATTNASALLDQLADTTTRIGNLVEAAKSYSQMDRAPVQHVAVTDGIESTLAMLGSKLDGITVVRDYGDVPRIEAFAFELNQVWTNLIDNAVDAMGGHGTLELRTRADGDQVVVEVTDSGHGIAPDVLQQVFEPFFTTKSLTKGTGLGLDITRRIVTERHGGTIGYESRPGRTTATVRLPLRRDPDPA